MTTRWFGKSWGAPMCEPETHTETPIGEPCAHCGEPIAADDYGVITPHVAGDRVRLRPMHFDCHMRRVVGSIAHQQGRCSCYGGAEPDMPPGKTRRQEAAEAVAHWERQQRGGRLDA